jgi:hypothetical protein
MTGTLRAKRPIPKVKTVIFWLAGLHSLHAVLAAVVAVQQERNRQLWPCNKNATGSCGRATRTQQAVVAVQQERNRGAALHC